MAITIPSSGSVSSAGAPSEIQNFTGATIGQAGAAGLVPSPGAGQQTYFLRGDGTWAQSLPAAQVTGLAAAAASGSYTDLINRPARALTCAISGGGVAITTGVAGFVYMPFAATITGWTLLGNITGSLTVDIWMGPLASFASISAANTICGGAPPSMTSARYAQSSAPTGWTTVVPAGDVLIFDVSSAATLTFATLILALAV